MGLGRERVGANIGTLYFCHLNDVCSGDPEAEPEVVAVTMGNQAGPLEMEIMILRLATAQFGNGLSMSWPRTFTSELRTGYK